nr:Uncharacterised protein [Providencia rettgeri]
MKIIFIYKCKEYNSIFLLLNHKNKITFYFFSWLIKDPIMDGFIYCVLH